MDEELSNSRPPHSEAERLWLCCTHWLQTLFSSCITEAENLWKIQRATLRVSERNHKPTSWRQKQRARLATCSSSVIPARSPQRRLLTNSGHRTPSVQFLHLSTTAKVTPDYTSEWYTCTSIFKQPRNQRLTASPVFTWGENQSFT